MPDFYIVSSFFYKKSKQARVPTLVWSFCDDATTAKGLGCDEGTNLRLRDFAVVPLMPTHAKIGQNVPMVKNVGQNVPKMNFYSICYEILGIIWDVCVKLF